MHVLGMVAVWLWLRTCRQRILGPQAFAHLSSLLSPTRAQDFACLQLGCVLNLAAAAAVGFGRRRAGRTCDRTGHDEARVGGVFARGCRTRAGARRCQLAVCGALAISVLGSCVIDRAFALFPFPSLSFYVRCRPSPLCLANGTVVFVRALSRFCDRRCMDCSGLRVQT